MSVNFLYGSYPHRPQCFDLLQVLRLPSPVIHLEAQHMLQYRRGGYRRVELAFAPCPRRIPSLPTIWVSQVLPRPPYPATTSYNLPDYRVRWRQA